jgi:hypothetical protein
MRPGVSIGKILAAGAVLVGGRWMRSGCGG